MRIGILILKHLINFQKYRSLMFKKMFDGNTVLLKRSEENDKHRYFYISGDMICSFLPNDIICKTISKMGTNVTLYSIAKCEKNILFSSTF